MEDLCHKKKIPRTKATTQTNTTAVIKRRSSRGYHPKYRSPHPGEFNVDHLRLDNNIKVCQKCNLLHSVRCQCLAYTSHARTAQVAAVMSCLRLVWNARRISLRTKLKLVQSLVKCIVLYACKTLTLITELHLEIQAAKVHWLQTIPGVSYADYCVQQ